MNIEKIRKTESFLKQIFNESIYLNEHLKEKEYRLEHSYRVANISKLIAQKEGFDEADFEGERTPFALSVGDADNIDRYDAYRIFETLERDRFLEKSFKEKVELVDTRLSKLKKALHISLGTKTAEEIWTERIVYYSGFLSAVFINLSIM